MPTYEYACKNCGEHLEVVQSFNDDPLTVCPACEGELRKIFHPIGITFKGSGFYKNDSRSGSGSSPASKGTDSSGESASSGTPAGDSGSSGSAASDSTSGGDSTKAAGSDGVKAPAAATGPAKGAGAKGEPSKGTKSPSDSGSSKAAAS